ncbi:MAG: PEP-CTERM sorting domain-containing protein [Pirellulales bacterium]|nr:PEP-CTERM sorting domain-containing protein [Pirellulales bacterium]
MGRVKANQCPLGMRIFACGAALALLGSLVLPATSLAVALIVNEYNCVSSGRYLDGGDYRDAPDREDTYFKPILDLADDGVLNDSNNGRIEGNGGNWIELVVVEDHLDLRGWELRWAETDATGVQTPAFDPWYGDPSIEQGIIAFSPTSAVWADLRAGTIITISERDFIDVDTDWDGGGDDRNFTDGLDPGEADVTIDLSTDTSYDPAGNDWWIHVSSRQEQLAANPLITTVTNVDGDAPGDFSVGPDDWQLSVYNLGGTLDFGPIGEDITDFGNFPGGLSDSEAARLEADPGPGLDNDNYDDVTSTTFSQPNEWGGVFQDFTGIRPTTVTLTSVGSGNWSAPTTWDDGTLTPTAETETVVLGSHTVQVTADGSASSLSINGPAAAVVVSPSRTLTVGRDVELASGSLGFYPAGTLDVGRNFIMSRNTMMLFFLDAASYPVNPGDPMVAVAGNAELYNSTTLALSAEMLSGPLGDLNARDWGPKPLTIVSAVGQLTGTFTNVMTDPAGPHLGYGVFYEGMSYTSNTAVMDLFQAAPGDTNGNHYINGIDIQNILAANKFGIDVDADWSEGDFDGNARVNGIDIQAILAANLFGLPDPYAAADSSEPAEGVLDLVVVPGEGVYLDTKGLTVNSYVLTSTAGVFTGEPAANLGLFKEDSDSRVSGSFAFTLNGEHFLGNIVGPEFPARGGPVDLYEDLYLTYTVDGAKGTYEARLIVVPEPGTLTMLAAVVVAALLAVVRRRRRS